MNNVNLPATDITATLQFSDRDSANAFAVACTTKTLMGVDVSRSNSVTVYNVTDETKLWINEYVTSANNH